MANLKPKPSLMSKGRSAKPPGSRTENHSKTKLKDSFTKMSMLAQPKLTANTKTRLK